MDVVGLDTSEISQKLEKYVVDYFQGFKLGKNQSMFAEGHTFDFTEVLHLIPEPHHHAFTDDSKFLGMCGDITVSNPQGQPTEHTLMLLLNEESSQAYVLATQQPDMGETVIIKDFL